MTPKQREAAKRLADDLQRFDGAERESLRDEAAALLRELAAEPMQEPGIEYKRGYEDALNDCIKNGGEAWARSMFANNAEHIKPVQKPVGWLHDETGDFEPSHKPWMDDDEEWVPLYAAPQQRTPLSDEVVAKLINDEWATPDVPSAWKFARAVERAHGITGEQK